jgi:arsenate reductase (glutaredoxin)
MLKIYHNPRCSKSRAGLNYLQEKGIEFETIEYLKEKFTSDELKHVLMLLNKKPEEMIRTHEEMYKKELKGKNFTDDEWIKIMVENPKLIHRPIVLGKHKGVWAQPPEALDEIL